MSGLNGFYHAPENEDPVIKDLRQNYDELHRMDAARLAVANAKALHSIAFSLSELVSISDVMLDEIQNLNEERNVDDELDD